MGWSTSFLIFQRFFFNSTKNVQIFKLNSFLSWKSGNTFINMTSNSNFQTLSRFPSLQHLELLVKQLKTLIFCWWYLTWYHSFNICFSYIYFLSINVKKLVSLFIILPMLSSNLFAQSFQLRSACRFFLQSNHRFRFFYWNCYCACGRFLSAIKQRWILSPNVGIPVHLWLIFNISSMSFSDAIENPLSETFLNGS